MNDNDWIQLDDRHGLQMKTWPKSPADLDEAELMEELEDSCRRWQDEQNCNENSKQWR